MSFEDLEESRYEGKPVSLYLFIYGPRPQDYFGYTSHIEQITNNELDSEGEPIARVYEPIPVDRDNITVTGSLDRTTLQITMPQTADIASLFRSQPPSQVISVRVRDGHVNGEDWDFRVVFPGRVLGAEFSEQELTLSCEPVTTSLQRPGLRRRYQYGCPYVLYGPECKADKEAATFTSIVQSVDGSEVTLPVGWHGSHEPADFLGGLLTWFDAGGLIINRTLIQVSESGVLVSGSTDDLVNGVSVDVVLGCNHKVEHCEFLHNNILNYGGQPWIPTKNPYGLVNNFY